MTDTTAGGMPPPGWYDDPTGVEQLRWWGGLAWTEHVKASEVPAMLVEVMAAPVVVAAAPVDAAPAAAVPVDFGFAEYVPAHASAPGYLPDVDAYRAQFQGATTQATGSANTLPIWILAFIPLVGVLLIFAMFNNLQRLDILIGLAAAFPVLLIVLGVWDRIALRRTDIEGPTLWWLLLAFPFSYLIARAVKLGRLGLKSTAPFIVYLVVGFVAGGVGGAVLALE